MQQQMQQRRRGTYETNTIPFGKVCLKLGLTPNALTLISFLTSIGTGYFFYRGWLIWGAVGILATIFTDMLDGATARAGKMGTIYGGILDHVSDRYAEAAILMGMSLSGLVHPTLPMFALFGMIIASYTRETAEAQSRIGNLAVGAAGRFEKFVILIAGSLGEYFFPGYYVLTIGLVIVGGISYLTSVQRLIYTKKALDERDNK